MCIRDSYNQVRAFMMRNPADYLLWLDGAGMQFFGTTGLRPGLSIGNSIAEWDPAVAPSTERDCIIVRKGQKSDVPRMKEWNPQLTEETEFRYFILLCEPE